MKKILTLGASAVALAALPVVGALAADGTLSQTDTVVVTVDGACSLATSASANQEYTATIANGAYNTNIAGSTFTVTCNDNGGWQISAVGSGTGTTVAHMDASTAADDDIPTGTSLTGSVSNWAFKVAAGTGAAAGATIQGSYDGFSEVPTTAQVVAKGANTTSSATVTATYGVSISPTQEAGTYTGKVTYTLAHPATNN